MQNKLSDLNNYLFAQIERLDDESLSGEQLDHEVKRAMAITDVAEQIIETGQLQVKACSLAHEVGAAFNVPQLLLGE